MILDIEKFISQRRPEWDEYESLLLQLEDGRSTALEIAVIQRLYFLHERVAADLTKLKAYTIEPSTISYLESLVARGYSEMHGAVRRTPLTQAIVQLVTAFPVTVRRHLKFLIISVGLFLAGAIFGSLALALDPSAKPVLMPFSHLLGDPSERVATEEADNLKGDVMAGGKSSFSAYLMTHNIKVALLALALGMTLGVGTGILLFYNGVSIGAVIFDYFAAGEGVFLVAWLLPHGSVEIPAIFFAGQAGLLLGSRLLFTRGRMGRVERLREIRGDLTVLVAGIAVLLVWAGVVESFLSQYHEPAIPYAAKITFGTIQLLGLVAYLAFVGTKKQGGQE